MNSLLRAIQARWRRVLSRRGGPFAGGPISPRKLRGGASWCVVAAQRPTSPLGYGKQRKSLPTVVGGSYNIGDQQETAEAPQAPRRAAFTGRRPFVFLAYYRQWNH